MGMAGGYGLSIPRHLPNLGIFHNDGIISVAPVNGIFATLCVAMGLLIALCLPNLAELTKENYGPMVHKKQHQIKFYLCWPQEIHSLMNQL